MFKHLSTICLLLSFSFFTYAQDCAPNPCPVTGSCRKNFSNETNSTKPEPRILVEIAAIGIDGFKKDVTPTELESTENSSNQRSATVTAKQYATLLLSAAKYSKICSVDSTNAHAEMGELLNMLGKVLKMKILSHPSLTLENGTRGLISLGGDSRHGSGSFDISVTPSINSDKGEVIDLNLEVMLSSTKSRFGETQKLTVSSCLANNKIMVIGGFLDEDDFNPAKDDFMYDLVVLVSAKIAEPIEQNNVQS